jgi:hypothetical protein
MLVAQQDLDDWRAFCGRLTSTLCAAEGALAAGSIEQTRELLWSAQDAASRMGIKLEIIGASRQKLCTEATISPSRQWYALMLRDAWDAARQMETEAGEPEGASRLLRLLLREVEEDLYVE